jgi:hypothetical protein
MARRSGQAMGSNASQEEANIRAVPHCIENVRWIVDDMLGNESIAYHDRKASIYRLPGLMLNLFEHR